MQTFEKYFYPLIAAGMIPGIIAESAKCISAPNEWVPGFFVVVFSYMFIISIRKSFQP